MANKTHQRQLWSFYRCCDSAAFNFVIAEYILKNIIILIYYFLMYNSIYSSVSCFFIHNLIFKHTCHHNISTLVHFLCEHNKNKHYRLFQKQLHLFHYSLWIILKIISNHEIFSSQPYFRCSFCAMYVASKCCSQSGQSVIWTMHCTVHLAQNYGCKKTRIPPPGYRL